MDLRLRHWIGILAMWIVFYILATNAFGDQICNDKIAETDLQLKYENVVEVFTTFLGNPSTRSDARVWELGRYTVYVVDLDSTTYVSLWRSCIPKRKAPKLKRLSRIGTSWK